MRSIKWDIVLVYVTIMVIGTVIWATILKAIF
jgi:hypothetical protein